jgi:hypothetical protein
VEVEPLSAAKAAAWIALCGGLAVWRGRDLGQPGNAWIGPAHLTDGSPAQRPHWSCGEKPDRVVTDPAQVEVVERREVRRFRIAVRPGYGLALVLTDASTRRLDAALGEAGDGATYAFEGRDAVVYAVASRTPLPAWLEAHPHAKAV